MFGVQKTRYILKSKEVPGKVASVNFIHEVIPWPCYNNEDNQRPEYRHLEQMREFFPDYEKDNYYENGQYHPYGPFSQDRKGKTG